MKLRLFSTALTALVLTLSAATALPAAADSVGNSVQPIAGPAAATDSAITVHWTVPPYGNALVGVFEVRATALDGSGATTSWIGINPWLRSYTFTGLASGTRYQIDVEAIMGHLTPTLSWTVSTTGPATSMRAPSITALSTSSTSVSVSWTAPVDTTSNPVKYFQVEAGPVAAGTGGYTPWHILAPSSTSVTLTGLTPGVQYALHLNTVATTGYIAIAQTRLFTTLPTGSVYSASPSTGATPSASYSSPATTYTGSSSVSSSHPSTSSSSLASPTSAQGRGYSIGLNTAEVSWSSPGTARVSRAELYTFKGSSCTSAAHSTSMDYNANNNYTNGYLTSTGPGFYSPAGPYSAYVVVINAAGSARSTCFIIGNS